MMVIHLLVGVAAVALLVAAGVAFVFVPTGRQLYGIAGWAFALLVIQAASGMFLLTATEEGPGPIHILLPLLGIAATGSARLIAPDAAGHRSAMLAAVYSIAAIGALAALVTGLMA